MTFCTSEPAVCSEQNERIKISIVDDDHTYRSLMKHAADRSRDLNCVGLYSSGVEALKGIPSSASEVVLVDVRMPGMPGTECARQLKRIQPQLPIIMISGFDDPDTLTHSLDAGADAFWAKRPQVGPFFETLKVWLRRRKPGANETRLGPNFLIAPREETTNPSPTTLSFPAPSQPASGSAIQDQRSGAKPEQDLFPDEPGVCNALNRMVVRLEQDLHTREDLLQEAWVHFWSMKQQRPGQRLNWYLQGVRFHLNDFRNSGRSVDALKRRGAQATFPDDCEEWDHWRDSLEFDEGFLSAVSSSDIFSLLVDRLKPLDRRILGELAEGLGVCEIAVKLNVSHPLVLNRRRWIAKLAIKLGITPLPRSGLLGSARK